MCKKQLHNANLPYTACMPGTIPSPTTAIAWQVAPAREQYAAVFGTFFDGVLKPSDMELKLAGQLIASVQNALVKLPAWLGKLDRIAEGGSCGKATHVRGRFDIDIVAFVNVNGSSMIPVDARKRMLKQAQRALSTLGFIAVKKAGNRRLAVKHISGLHVDIVLVENR